MRKFLAAALSAIIMLGSVMPLAGLLTSAAAADATYTQINFDDEGLTNFYGNARNLSSTISVQSSDTASDKSHGNAVAFTTFSSVWNTNEKWPQNVRISNYDGSAAFKVEEGEKYKISFDYKKSKVDTVDINMWAVYTGQGSSNLGTLESHKAAGRTGSVGWIAKGTSGWLSYSNTITAAKSGEMVILPITYNVSQVKNQKLWIDNIRIEKIVNYDGSKVSVKYNMNDGTDAQTREMYAGYSYGHPSREGYVFGGWYADEALKIEAPATVRADCTEVWAKWTPDNRVPQETVNTYDDEGITYVLEGDNTYFTTETEKTYFGVKSVTVGETTGADGGRTNALHFEAASQYTWQWPRIALIYDSATKQSEFKPNSGSAYEISIKYRADKKPSTNLYFQIERVAAGIGNPNGAYNTSNIYLADLAEVSDVTDGWVTASGYFYTSNDTKLTITLVASGGSSASDVDVWVDDITIKERLDVHGIYFETNGGSDKAAVNCIAGYDIPVIEPPTREGYYFNGWYTDPALENGFVYGKMPAESVTLYAAWVKAETEAKELCTGFESGEYEKVPYAETENAVNASDNSMKYAVWHENGADEAYDGNSYITFDDGELEAVSDENAQRWMSVGLYNSDGTPYQLISGQRYKVSFAYRHMGHTTNVNCNIKLLVTQQVPGAGISSSNSTAVVNISALRGDSHDSQVWGEYSTYVIPSVSGIAKIAVTANYTNNTIDLDNVKIEPMSDSECVKVEYYSVDPDGTNECLSATRLGAAGDLLIQGDALHKDGYAFDGWRDENNELYLSNYFPKQDLKLYASWREADKTEKPFNDWSSGEVVIDFEDTANAKAFYEDSANNYHASNGTFLMVNDPENAHSGNNYFKYYYCGHWTNQYLRSMKFYDPQSPGNQIYLEPNSVYKVSFWLNIEDVGAGNLYLATFPNIDNRKDWEIANENYITETNKFEEFGKWVKYENTVVTGDDEDGDGVAATLGFVLYGGYLTASLDDITVTKLSEITVSYEPNGGNDVPDTEQLSHDYVIAPDDPEREGYTFTGWYTDKELTQKFDFQKTLVTKSMTLYAGWEKIPEAPKSTFKTTTVTHTEYEEVSEEVEVTPNDAELDGQITVIENDTVGIKKTDTLNKTDVTEEKSGSGIMRIIIIICAAVLLLAVLVAVIIILKKRKNKI